MNWDIAITIYYSTPILLMQLFVCVLLWRQTKDNRTWGLLIAGSLMSIIARVIILQIPVANWIDDLVRAISITVNTIGFYSLYLLLNKLIKKRRSLNQ